MEKIEDTQHKPGLRRSKEHARWSGFALDV